MAKTRRQRERKRVSAQRRVQDHKTGGESNYLTVPDGMAQFQPKAGTYRLDFMSYRVGKGNPFAKQGEAHFERTFWVHRDVGPNNDWHLCLAKTLKKPCPVCEYRAKLARDPDADENLVKALAPKERQLWLVRDLNEADSGVMLWEFSYHLFGSYLDKKIRSADEEDEYQFFADPEDGLTVRVVFEESDRGKWIDTTDIEFKPRKKNYDVDSIDEMPCLDDLLTGIPYDKLKALFLQTDDEDDEEEKPEAKSKQTDDPIADDLGIEKGSTVTHDDYGGCTVTRISKDGTSLTIEDDDGDVHKAIGCDEVELVKKKKTTRKSKTEPVDDDDDEKPKAKTRAKTKPKPKPVDDDDDEDDLDDWDDDEEEKPKRKSKSKAKAKEDDDEDEDEWDDFDED